MTRAAAAQALPPPVPLTGIEAALAGFTAATPALLAQRDLLRRIDSKFVVTGDRLETIVAALAGHYAVLRVPTGDLATYASLYFDTPDLRCYHDHRRGRRLRHKVRVRHYPDRELSFLEIKTKRNDLVTDKHRLALRYGAETLGPIEHDFLRGHFGPGVEQLRPELWIEYRRLSLIGTATHERVTIDLGIEAVELDGRRRSFGDLAVIEIKQAPFCVRTPVMRAVLGAGLREQSMSKYTTAIALGRPGERRNRLLPGLRAIERMSK